MSTILKKQYEVAKELLKSVEFCYRYYETCGRTQKDFDYFYNNATSLLTIFGHVHIGMSVQQKDRQEGISILDLCRQQFAAYEAELKSEGIIPRSWEEILQDVEPTEPMVEQEYTEEQKLWMWHEYQKQCDYDPQF